jgi:hypothetical protein
MDRRIFDQLDRLEHDARYETRPSRHVYNDSSAEYSAFDAPDYRYTQDGSQVPDWRTQDADLYSDEPMTLDSFGKTSHAKHHSAAIELTQSR